MLPLPATEVTTGMESEFEAGVAKAIPRIKSTKGRQGMELQRSIEKPTLHYDVSMGIYCYDQRALSYLPAGPCQFPDLVLRLLEAGEPVAAYRTDAAWYDIGTLPEYERAQADLEAMADLRT